MTSSQTLSLYSISFNVNYNANESLVLTDSNGKHVINATVTNSYSNLVVSTSSIISGNTYILTSNGSELASVSVSDVITYYGSGSQSMQGFQGRRP